MLIYIRLHIRLCVILRKVVISSRWSIRILNIIDGTGFHRLVSIVGTCRRRDSRAIY